MGSGAPQTPGGEPTLADELERMERFVSEYGELVCFLLCLALAQLLLIAPQACVPEPEPEPAAAPCTEASS